MYDNNNNNIYIAGSVGCFGASLGNRAEYTGDYKCESFPESPTAEQLADFHAHKVHALLVAGIDFLAFETVPNLLEAEAIVLLLNTFKPKVKVWVTFGCQNGQQLNSGESFAEAIRICEACEYITYVGVNCTSPHFITPLLTIASQNSSKELVTYPNSGGDPGLCTHANVFDQLCENTCHEKFDLKAEISKWVKLGVKCLGGCCDTTPEQITSLANYVRQQDLMN